MTFVGFVVVGGIAGLVNILARILFDLYFSYEIAIVLAFPIALTVAFCLNKWFVFQAKGAVLGEYARFAAVNLAALAQVWLVTVGLARYLFPAIGFTWQAETVAHAIGVFSPVVTSFYGHKYFSFRGREAA